MAEENAVKSLIKLGLTVSQAKVYLTLAKSGPCTGRATAGSTHIATNDVYRILSELHEIGLTEKIIAKPTKYKATQIDDSLLILLQRKKEEYIEAEEQVKALSDSLAIKKQERTPQDDSQFIITSEIKSLFKMHEKLAQESKLSIDFVLPIKAKATELLDEAPQQIRDAVKRKVKIRGITMVNEGHSEKKHKGVKPALFEVRTIKDINPPFGMHIFDKKEITLAISEKPMPSLWTNNAHVVRLARAYFEEMWNNANRDEQ